MSEKPKIPKGYYKVTRGQIDNIAEAANYLSSMCGGMDEETEADFKKIIRNIDRFLNQNGMKRTFN